GGVGGWVGIGVGGVAKGNLGRRDFWLAREARIENDHDGARPPRPERHLSYAGVDPAWRPRCPRSPAVSFLFFCSAPPARGRRPVNMRVIPSVSAPRCASARI